jgi:hypothetical protein
MMEGAGAVHSGAKTMICRTTCVPGLLLTVACAFAANAERVCGTIAPIELGGVPVLPFGGEVIGASTLEGTVVSTTVELTFTATGSFDAADIGLGICLPIDGGIACHGVTGAALGWSGQGTFVAQIPTNALNGDLALVDGPFYTWFATISNLNPGGGPISGTIDVWSYVLHMADCPVGDLTGDIAVGFDDLVMLLAAWGERPDCEGAVPCGADLDGDGVVGIGDLILLLSNWGDAFCPAPFC